MVVLQLRVLVVPVVPVVLVIVLSVVVPVEVIRHSGVSGSVHVVRVCVVCSRAACRRSAGIHPGMVFSRFGARRSSSDCGCCGRAGVPDPIGCGR